MLMGLEWYWWIFIIIAVITVVPLKVKFMKWWSHRQYDKKAHKQDKWGDEE